MLLSLLSDALDQVRLRHLRKYKDDQRSDEYYLLKCQKREMIFSIGHEIETALALKEKYLYFDDNNLISEERKEVLESLINDIIASDIPEMISVGLTLSSWKEEILNSFCTITKQSLIIMER